jgi:hypothetical protein
MRAMLWHELSVPQPGPVAAQRTHPCHASGDASYCRARAARQALGHALGPGFALDLLILLLRLALRLQLLLRQLGVGLLHDLRLGSGGFEREQSWRGRLAVVACSGRLVWMRMECRETVWCRRARPASWQGSVAGSHFLAAKHLPASVECEPARWQCSAGPDPQQAGCIRM